MSYFILSMCLQHPIWTDNTALSREEKYGDTCEAVGVNGVPDPHSAHVETTA